MFRNKEYVLAVFEEGSFSKAAKRLYISQPSLSASIKRIEDKIGANLFDRATSPVSLTEAGEQYVKYALWIKVKEQDFERYISDYTKLLMGTVKIGGTSLFSSFMLPKMISKFNKKYPDVNFEIFEHNTKDLIQKLELGMLDIVIDNKIINDESISSMVYTDETLLLAVPKKFKVNEKLKKFQMTAENIKCEKNYLKFKGVSIENFSEYPFILLNKENDTGKRANKLFKKHNINPEVIINLEQQVTAYNVSCTGLGITFVSDTLIKNIDSEPMLFYYKLLDDEVKRNIYFYKKNNRYLSNACKKFIEENISK